MNRASSHPALRQCLLKCGSALLIGLSTFVTLPLPATAAERIYFTYGPFGRSIPISDLRTFADTGKTTRQLRWYLRFADVEPEALQSVLTTEVSLQFGLVNRTAYSLPGEFVLLQAGQIVHTKSRQGIVQIKALRSTLVASTVDDNQISLIEFLEKYPTPELYVDGVILARAARRVRNVVARIEPTLAVIQEFLANIICDCEAPTNTPLTDTPSSSAPDSLLTVPPDSSSDAAPIPKFDEP
jgi:hypothetical protein